MKITLTAALLMWIAATPAGHICESAVMLFGRLLLMNNPEVILPTATELKPQITPITQIAWPLFSLEG